MHLHLASVAAAIAALLSGSAAAAPDRTLGVVLMSAVVDQDGGLLGGSGAVSAERLGVGVYDVQFVRPTIGCVAVANVGGPTTRVGQVLQAATLNGLGMRITTREGTALDNQFEMLVFCPK